MPIVARPTAQIASVLFIALASTSSAIRSTTSSTVSSVVSRRTASSAGCVFDGVALVAVAEIGGERLRVDARSVRRAPARALVLVGEQEDLHLGVRVRRRVPMSRPSITESPPSGERALPLAHDLAHLGMARDRRHEAVDLGVSDRSRHVLAVDLHEPACAERDRMRERELREQRIRPSSVDAVTPRDPGQRAVHRPVSR